MSEDRRGAPGPDGRAGGQLGTGDASGRLTRRALVAGATAALALPGAARAQARCLPNVIEFRTATGGFARFRVELALTAAEQARGLMHRTALSDTGGMLFIYERPQPSSFWMKNTLIPLDMIFLSPDGRVAHVHENAVPHDETPIFGGDSILAVLEINGGLAAKLGIAPGTLARHPAFGAAAAWAC